MLHNTGTATHGVFTSKLEVQQDSTPDNYTYYGYVNQNKSIKTQLTNWNVFFFITGTATHGVFTSKMEVQQDWTSDNYTYTTQDYGYGYDASADPSAGGYSGGAGGYGPPGAGGYDPSMGGAPGGPQGAYGPSYGYGQQY